MTGADIARGRPLLSRITRTLAKVPRAPRTTRRTGTAPPPRIRRGTGLRSKVDARTARPHVEYAPCRDGDADPGEIVWTWVPYEDDPSQGKDRPVLVIGRWGEDVAALALTSRDKGGRHQHPVGVWDRRDGRPSFVKLDRLLRLDPDAIRREGEVLDEQRFREAVRAWERY